MFHIELIVRPRSGVRDPQGEAVEESLRDLGYQTFNVNCVGRYLSLTIDAPSAHAASEMAEDMCRRLLVNPNLETSHITVRSVE